MLGIILNIAKILFFTGVVIILLFLLGVFIAWLCYYISELKYKLKFDFYKKL